jgi:hypothetical protein
VLNRGLGLGLLLVLCASPSLAADRVTGAAQDGYRRLNFTLDGTAKVTATTSGGVLAIAFDRKPGIDPAAIMAAAPGLITSARADDDGKTLRFALSQPIKLHVSQQGDRAVVDLAPAAFTGAMPDLPPPAKPAPPKPVEAADLPQIKLRAGNYSNFTRMVFDWTKTVPYTVFPGAGKLTVRFGAPTRFDLSILSKLPPAWVKNASWRLDGNSTLVEFTTDSDSGFHDFRDGTKIVLDILAPKTDATAYTPPGENKAVVTKVPAGASTAQAKAITDAAAQLAGKKPEASKPEAKPVQTAKADLQAAPAKPDPHAGPAKPEAKPATQAAKVDPHAPAAKPDPHATQTKTAEAKPADANAEATPVALPGTSAQRTQSGVSLLFRNAPAAAVFIRGLTAWVVLPDAPAPDVASLKKSLGDYALGVEASSSPGLSVLRISLKTSAKIAARGEGTSLRVLIGPDVASDATVINFARNQTDPRRTSLATSLPRARQAVPLADPATGDTLTVIPSSSGYAVPTQKIFADFAVLPSAQGLVIAPYADDLTITVADARVAIARPGGMALTPPQMPVASSPAALANALGGPSYLDLAKWGQLTAGSFLATQRALQQDLAARPPQQRNMARLKLARFLLAQGFGPEALGLINLIQANDPALKGDIQLATMRAAASVQMGRWRDARNELGGPLYDADRNAMLWRGLADAGMGNWADAHRQLEAADAVMPRYPALWQARAAIARAEAAIEIKRLDLADAAISRLPKSVPPNLVADARLIKARIAAGEARYETAMPEFAALEKGSNERITAQANYYRTEAGMAAGTVSDKQGIEALERLRYRWRGDQLELKTLRKLASLYFKGHDWNNGLKTLRVARENFTGEAARMAHDDMLRAFADLYLKGGADKLPPVQSLALFYDNIDLTPIGPEGDEMIRRMSDRLVAVDLLAPATDLLAYQVEKRLDGIAKAQVATRLAAVQLMNRKPADAIGSLRNSQITGLPDDVLHARLMIEARALVALKQYDNALDLVGVDETAETRQLRADIYWESGNWAVAAQKLEEMLAPALAAPAALSAEDRVKALRAAVAYSLANDEKSLERVRAGFGPKLKGTPEANLFAVLSQPIEMHGLAFREAAAQIASVDTLKSFMSDLQKKFAAPKGS